MLYSARSSRKVRQQQLIIKYRVLGAMLALHEFDTEQLARLSEVRITTVRTIVGRLKDSILDEIGIEETNKPGGKLHRYRIKPSQVDSVRRDYLNLFRQLRFRPGAIPQAKESIEESNAFELCLEETIETSAERSIGAPSPSAVPLAVLAAEDSLVHHFPTLDNVGEQRHILKMAEIACFDENQDDDNADPRTSAHFEGLRALVELSRAELSKTTADFLQPPTTAELRAKTVAAARSLGEAGEFTEAIDLLSRLTFSPVMGEITVAGNIDDSDTKALNETPNLHDDMVFAKKYQDLTARSKSILGAVTRIQVVRDPLKRMADAISAASAESSFVQSRLKLDLDAESERMLVKVRPRFHLVLRDQDIQVLGTMPAFYCPGVVSFATETGPCLQVPKLLEYFNSFRQFTGQQSLPPVHESWIQFAAQLGAA